MAGAGHGMQGKGAHVLTKEIEALVADLRKRYGDKIADQYQELCEKIHACALKKDFAGMRAVVNEAKALLEDVKRQQEQQQQ